MRRGVGVAHVQKKTQMQQQMSGLGEQMTAERVGQIADEIEGLESHLRTLAEKHKDEIKQNPILRARFRQLADSLGIDLISSKKNIFAGILGLGDFYYGLASKVVEACMRERKFCGSYVPLKRIVLFMRKEYSAGESNGKGSDITEDDVCMALDKLYVLGEGYNVVKLAGVKYIQTTPDGVRSADDAPLLNVVLEEQARQIADYRASTTASMASKTQHSAFFRAGGTHWTTASTATRNSSDHSDISRENETIDVPLDVQCVALTQNELERRLMWGPHRVHAVLERMIQNGSVWVEQAVTVCPSNGGGDSQEPMMAMPELEAERVYWFIAFTLQDGSLM